MSRWKASGIHLLLSAAIASAVLVFMLTVWYPWPLFEIAGGDRLIFILIGVDVTLGPIITLIIFKAGKKGLKFDLTVIALAQLAALTYGMHAVFLARPIYIAFTVDQFELVSAKDIDPQDLAKVTRPEFKRLPLGRPQYIAVAAPKDLQEKSRLVEAFVTSGKDLFMFPQYYVPYDQRARDALVRAKPLRIILARAPEVVKSYLTSSARSEDSVKFLPLRSPHGDGAVLLDATTGRPLKILMVNPW